MDGYFWHRCSEAMCAIASVRTYSQFGADGNIDEQFFEGVKFMALPFEDYAVGPDYYTGIEEHQTGRDRLYDDPEQALIAYEMAARKAPI